MPSSPSPKLPFLVIAFLLIVHAPIGQDADICGVARLLRIRGKAYAASHLQCVVIDLEGLLQHLLQPFLDLSYHMLIEIHAEEDREFIAADAEYIVIFTNAQQEALRRFLQELIPIACP